MPYGAVNSRTSRSYEPCRPVRIALSTGTPPAEAAATVRGSIGQTGPTRRAVVAGEVADGAGLVAVAVRAAGTTAVGDCAVVEARAGETPAVLVLQAAAPTSAAVQTARTAATRNARTACTARRAPCSSGPVQDRRRRDLAPVAPHVFIVVVPLIVCCVEPVPPKTFRQSKGCARYRSVTEKA